MTYRHGVAHHPGEFVGLLWYDSVFMEAQDKRVSQSAQEPTMRQTQDRVS